MKYDIRDLEIEDFDPGLDRRFGHRFILYPEEGGNK